MNKPDGMVEVTREGLQKFLWPLDISRIWGLGPTSKKALNDMGIFTIGELAAFPPERLQALFGKAGLHYWELANGIDERNVEAEGEAKSISNEVTFDEDTSDRDRITTAMMELCEKTSWRLRREGLMARTVTVKIRLSGFETHTRSETVKKMTNFTDDTYRTAMGLYDGFDNRGKKVRLVGVKLSNLMPFGTTEDLFRSPEDPKREEVHKAVDQIVDRFGSGAIFRATAWRKTPSRRGRAP
jgi:nucleotidyltransferase/DNA polymerase involved in DNA repair